MSDFQVPNSPFELFAMNDFPATDEGKGEFVGVVEDMLQEVNPEPYEVIQAVCGLLEKVERYHFEAVEGDGNGDLSPWQRKLFSDDLKRIGKALTQLRAINPD